MGNLSTSSRQGKITFNQSIIFQGGAPSFTFLPCAVNVYIQVAELLSLIRMHRSVTVSKGLTTTFPSIYMRDSSHNLIMEIVEWASAASVSRAAGK